MSNANQIREYLDTAADRLGYLDAINGTTPESLIDAQMKMHPLRAALGDSVLGPLVSIGVGQGEEIHALRSVFGPARQLVGIDLSQAALQRAHERSDSFKLGAYFIEADACDLPLPSRSVGAVVMSAILHEIYSYNEPDGRTAFERSIVSVTDSLENSGVLYVREFACPPQEESVRLVPITEEASDFFDYFTNEFRIGLQDGTESGIEFDKTGRLKRTGDLTQILLHFRNFWHDHAKGLTQIGDGDWKELKESYVIPDADHTKYMDPMELCDDIVDIVDKQSGDQLELVELSTKMRKKVNIFLEQHFKIENKRGKDATRRLIQGATGKLEATLRKVS